MCVAIYEKKNKERNIYMNLYLETNKITTSK